MVALIMLFTGVLSGQEYDYLDTVPIPDPPIYDFSTVSVSASDDSILDLKFMDYTVYEFDKDDILSHIDTQNYVITVNLLFRDGGGDPERQWEMLLQRNVLISEDFVREFSDSNGTYTDTSDFYPEHTFKGELLNDTTVRFSRLTISPSDFNILLLSDSNLGIVEPLSNLLPSAPSDKYIFYRAEDVLLDSSEVLCGYDLIEQPDFELPEGTFRSGFCDLRTLEIATDANYEFDQYFNESPPGNGIGTFNRILSLLNQVEGLYNYYFNLNFQVNYMHRWTNGKDDDPYTGENLSTMLGEFRSYWQNDPQFSAIKRDVAHLFAAEDETGYGGWAYRSSVCSNPNLAYSITENRYMQDYAPVVMLAHELGHNLSAGHHFPSGDCDNWGPLMCSWVQREAFYMGQPAQNSINKHITDHGSCLQITSSPSYNNGWEKVYTNDARSNWLGCCWDMKDDDTYVVGDFDGDGVEEFCGIHTAYGWNVLMQYDCGEWRHVYNNGGNQWMGGWLFNEGDRFYSGDFDGDGKDEILCVGPGEQHWAMVLEFVNPQTGWTWIWHNNGNGKIQNWEITGSETFLVADFKDDGEDQLLAFTHETNPLGMLQSFQSTYWQIEWTNFGNGTIGSKDLSTNMVYVSGDFGNFNSNTKHELLVLDMDTQEDPESFQYNSGAWQSVWDGSSASQFAGWSITSALPNEIHTGDIDEADNYDEVVFLQLGSSADDAASIDYDASLGDFQENWSNSGTTPYIHDWALDEGTNHTYFLIAAQQGDDKKYLMTIRKQSSGWPHLASMYRTSYITNYKRGSEEYSHGQEITANQLVVYPNPSTGLVHLDGLRFDSDQNFEVSVMGLDGRILYSSAFSGRSLSQTLSLSDIPSGFFLISVLVNGERFTKGLIVQ